MIKIPIQLDTSQRPMAPAPSPYGQCCNCRYVYEGVSPEEECPACGSPKQCYLPWPTDELVELWKEQVDIWNRERVELAVIVASMYFESSIFHMMYLGMAWLDPQLNRLDATFDETPEKEQKIWDYLNSIRTRERTDATLKRLFGHHGQDMLRATLGDEDSQYYWDNYRGLAAQRNQIVHRGRRYAVRGESGEIIWAQPQVNELLSWCLKWIPACWVVFSKLHNKYIHPPMWERKTKM